MAVPVKKRGTIRKVVTLAAARNVALPVPDPDFADFSLKPLVFKKGNVYFTTFSIAKQKPVGLPVIHVDPTMANDNGDGLTTATARRDLSVVINALSAPADIVLMDDPMADGSPRQYRGAFGWNAVHWRYPGIIRTRNKRKVRMVAAVSAQPVWTLDQGTTYTTPSSVAPTSVCDGKNTDSFGSIYRQQTAASIAACRATPGTMYRDTTNNLLYVNPIDGRNLVGDLQMFVGNLNQNNARWTPLTAVDSFIDDVHFIGGTTALNLTCATADILPRIHLSGCRWEGASGNGIALEGPMEVYSEDGFGGASTADGTNQHRTSTSGKSRAFHNRLISGRNGYGTPDGTPSNNNAATVHEDCVAILLNPDLRSSEGPPVAGSQGGKFWILGGSIGSTQNPLNSDVAAGDTCRFFLDGVKKTRGAGFADLNASTYAQVNVRNMDLAGLVLQGQVASR